MAHPAGALYTTAMPKFILNADNYSLDFGNGLTSIEGFAREWPWFIKPTSVEKHEDGFTYHYNWQWDIRVQLAETTLGVTFTYTFTNRQPTAQVPPGFHPCALPQLKSLLWATNTAGQPGVLTTDLIDGRKLTLAIESAKYVTKVCYWQLASPFDGRAYLSVWPGGIDAKFQQTVPPGQSVVVKLSVNVGADATSHGNKAMASWRATYPQKLNWTDRRPIMALFPSGGQRTTSNPQGWLYGRTPTTAEEIRLFHDWLRRHAEACVANGKLCNAQGMVCWNIEGMKHQAFTYYGNPALAEVLAPELQGALDDFFAIFRNAGLRTGVCIRPQQLAIGVPVADPNFGPLKLSVVDDYRNALLGHVAYARSRWGCTLFYVDSTNGDDTPTMRFLQSVYPDCLFMPEGFKPGYIARGQLAYAAQYVETGKSVWNVDRKLYSKAFGVRFHWMTILNQPGVREQLIESVKAGDVLFVAGHYNDGSQQAAKEIYAAAGKAL
jgi:hypothetical protein